MPDGVEPNRLVVGVRGALEAVEFDGATTPAAPRRFASGPWSAAETAVEIAATTKMTRNANAS
jgi:hypothetical protein